MRVFVYFNLHRKLWSIKAMEGPNKGRVIAHKHSLVLTNVTPKVSQAGRMRVLRDKQKNVHAGIVGHYSKGQDVAQANDTQRVTYNPYKYEGFVYADTESPFTGANVAHMVAGRVFVS